MFGTLRRYSKRKQALKAHQAALAAVADAEKREDTRDIGRTRARVKETMTALLKAEVVSVRR